LKSQMRFLKALRIAYLAVKPVVTNVRNFAERHRKSIHHERLPRRSCWRASLSRKRIFIKALDPFLENENFRRAIKDYDTEAFKAYDKRIRNDVTFLIDNLCKKFRYTKQGAREVCMYVVDSNLAKEFAN